MKQFVVRLFLLLRLYYILLFPELQWESFGTLLQYEDGDRCGLFSPSTGVFSFRGAAVLHLLRKSRVRVLMESGTVAFRSCVVQLGRLINLQEEYKINENS